MADETQWQRMKLDLPEAYTRAIRVRAGLDGVNPRDVVMAALDVHLADELAQVKKRLGDDGPGPAPPTRPRGRSRKSAPPE